MLATDLLRWWLPMPLPTLLGWRDRRSYETVYLDIHNNNNNECAVIISHSEEVRLYKVNFKVYTIYNICDGSDKSQSYGCVTCLTVRRSQVIEVESIVVLDAHG